MHIPSDGWSNGAWNNKLPQFRLLAEMLGYSDTLLSPEELQTIFHKVASAKAFAENVQAFLDATGKTKRDVMEHLEKIEQKLGLMEPIPFMSMDGFVSPSEFDGVAIWPAGITNWTMLRLEQIQTAQQAGAGFRRILVFGSSRVCKAPADRRHPLITGIPEGEEPTEQELQHRLVQTKATNPDLFRFVELPEQNEQGRPLSLEQQLAHFMASGQYDELVNGADIYVPSTPNSLYVPLHVRRVLGHDNVWFSQSGARLVRNMPDSWWPTLQDVMTTPNGIIRLWVELQHAGCITT